MRRPPARAARDRARGGRHPRAWLRRLVRAAGRALPAARLPLPELRRGRALPQGDRHPRRVVRFWLHAPGGAGHPPGAARGLGARGGRRTCGLLRGPRPASRLVQLVPHGERWHHRPRSVHRRADPRMGARFPGLRDAQVERELPRAPGSCGQVRRGDRALVGARDRLEERRARRGRDPAAGGRRLPQGTEHVPVPAREPRRFRPGRWASRRPAHARGPCVRPPPGCARCAHARGVRGAPVPSGARRAARSLHGGPLGGFPRRGEGPALHAGSG